MEENIVTDASGALGGAGILVSPAANGFPFTPVANANKIEENTIKHFAFPIFDLGTNTVLEENKIVP